MGISLAARATAAGAVSWAGLAPSSDWQPKGAWAAVRAPSKTNSAFHLRGAGPVHSSSSKTDSSSSPPPSSSSPAAITKPTSAFTLGSAIRKEMEQASHSSVGTPSTQAVATGAGLSSCGRLQVGGSSSSSSSSSFALQTTKAEENKQGRIYKSLEDIPLELVMSLQKDELTKMVEESESGSDVEMEPDERQKRKSRGDLPTRPRSKKKRGVRNLAMALIRDPVKFAYWKARVREDFFARTVAGSKNSKRKTVEILAMEVIRAENMQFTDIYPLTPGLIIGVAAALKGAEYRAADQYLGELRLGHIESEHPVPEYISRVLANCRRSVLRGLGPPSRAAELPRNLVVASVVPAADRGAEDVVDGLASYVVAEAWLLREIEIANSELADVRDVSEEAAADDSEHQLRVVELSLPVSKADYRGRGARRRLRCECAGLGAGAVRLCGPCTLWQQRNKRITELGGDPEIPSSITMEMECAPLFPTVEGGVPTKAKMVQAWNELRPAGHPALGGHTPRRSGAKRRAREGWDIQVIMVLGRWASSAILGYIEEAMAELIPGARKKFADHMDDWEQALPALSKRVGDLEKQVAALRKAASAEKAARAQLEAKVAAQEPEPCEVVVENRRFLRSTRPNGKIH